MLRTLLFAALAGLIAAPAPAGATNEAGSDARFNELDRNGDGLVSRDEGRDAEELNTRFSELDVNNDGKLSRDEYAVLQREAAEKLAKDRHSTRRTSAAGGSK
jgi:Ca2+-binding EF-hand superfamily protein